jgi:hypothetical protein
MICQRDFDSIIRGFNSWHFHHHNAYFSLARRPDFIFRCLPFSAKLKRMDNLDPSVAEAAEAAQKFLARIDAAAAALKGKSVQDIDRAKNESGLPPAVVDAIVGLNEGRITREECFLVVTEAVSNQNPPPPPERADLN